MATELVTGWRRLVFANPSLPQGLVDKAAYSFCVLEHLHRSLRRRDVFARDGDRWVTPRQAPGRGEVGGRRAEGAHRATSRSPPGCRATPRWRWWAGS
ncbi:hypothetical protein NKH77_49795 [Streptomyces sp. M19]